MQSPARPLSETEKGPHCVAEEKEGGREEEGIPALLLKQTWVDIFRASYGRFLGPQLPVGLMGALTQNLSAGPGCAHLSEGNPNVCN